MSAGKRCDNGSLVHSAVRKDGGKRRADSYVPGQRHARGHLRKRGDRFF